MLKRAILAIAGAFAVGALAVPAASASTTAAQPSCYGPAAARCLVATQPATSPALIQQPSLKYGPQSDATAQGPGIHYHT
ncbi:MAG: hypothetical protein ACRDNF_01365 [Streptosporangiaceae bacterium]